MRSLVAALLFLSASSCRERTPEPPVQTQHAAARDTAIPAVASPPAPAVPVVEVAPPPLTKAPAARSAPEPIRHVSVRVPPGHHLLRIQVGTGGSHLQDLPIDTSGSSTIPPRDEGGHWSYVRALGDGDLCTPWEFLLYDHRDVELTLVPGAALTGQIVAATSRAPIAGAEVTITEGGTTADGVSNPINLILATQTTDADGSFAPVIVPRDRAATFSVRAEHYADRERAVWVPKTGDVAATTIAMEPGGSVSGVVRSPDGRPLAGARVGVVTREYISPTGEASIGNVGERPPAESDSQGVFRIAGLKLDVEWHLVASAENWAESRASAPVVLTSDRPDGHMDVVVRASGRLDVVVVDASGRPVEDARVAWEEGGMVLDSFAKRIEPGRHRFDGLAPCVIPLTVTAPGFAPVNQVVEMHESERRELVVRMVPPAEIRGTVVDDLGNPVPHANVRWEGDKRYSRALDGEVETSADGTFVASGLQAGRYRFSVDRGDVEDAASVFEAPAKDALVRMVRRGAIVFRLRLPPGVPRPGDIGCSIPDGSGTAQPFGDGWRVDDLSVGHRRIALHLRGYDELPIDADIRPGADTDVGERTLVASATWRGRVVDVDGHPISGARVQRRRDAGWPVAETTPVYSDAGGRFVVEHVDAAPEAYLVEATGFAEEHPRIGGADLPATVMLRRGSLVTVQAVDGDGKPAPGGLLRVLLAGTGDEDNETLRWIMIDERGRGAVRLPPGRWRIGTGGRRWHDVETQDGVDLAVDVAK
jgi:protocatechuate 3,4-dioxygenase beta subunit